MHAPPPSPLVSNTAGTCDEGAPAVGASAVVTTDGRIDLAALLDAIATEPRPAGGDAEARVRRLCAALLEARGWRVRERPFAYSALPGRWGTPVGGVASIALLVAAARLGGEGNAGAALLTLIVGGSAIVTGARRLTRHGVLDAPWLRGTGVNLEAMRDVAIRDGAPPAVWLVAHLDSKSQPVPIGVRAAGVTLMTLAWMAALGVAALQLLTPAAFAWTTLWTVITVFAIVGGAPVAASVVGEASPGALDNASGVATVLLAADQLARAVPDANVGVLLTSAEELGLAGARAWVRQQTTMLDSHAQVLNCDGVDDDGHTLCMHTGARVPPAIAAAVRDSAVALGQRAPRLRRLLPGVLTDGVAFTDAGWDAVTLSRGTWRTLARIHGRRDRRQRLSGAGIEQVAALLAESAIGLARRETGAGHRRSGEGG